MNKLFKWLDQIETIVYTIVECDAGDMSYDDFLLTGGRLKKLIGMSFTHPMMIIYRVRSPFIKILLKNWKFY